MEHFKPKKMILVYRPGSDKALYNLLKYSPVPIETVYLADHELAHEERRRYYDYNPSLVFSEDMKEALDTNADAVLWTREVFETENDYKLWQQVILAASEKGKNIYDLARVVRLEDDSTLQEAVNQNQVKYWSASNHALSMAEIDPFGDYPEAATNAKVLIVLGTERRCGKFTATQVIRARLQQKGLKVAELATEPYGLLTGADYIIIPQVMPMWRATPAVRNIVSHLDRTLKPDIILVSSQSGIRATALDAAGRCGGIVAYTIALGAVPDACILSTSFDTIPIVAEEKKYLEFLIQRPVLGLAVKGRGQNPDEMDRVMKELRASLKIPVFDPICNPDTIQDLIQTIITMVS